MEEISSELNNVYKDLHKKTKWKLTFDARVENSDTKPVKVIIETGKIINV